MEDRLSILKEILLGILGIDNSQRRYNEQRLEELKKEPDSLVLCLLKLLQTSDNPDHRKLITTLLKTYISPNSFDNVWKVMNEETKKVAKEQLLTSLVSELNPKVTRLICLVIAELAATIHNSNNKWNELDPFIYKLITEGTELQRTMGYLVLNYMFGSIREKYEKHSAELASLFVVTLVKDVLEVRVECIATLCHLLANSSSQYIDAFVQLLPYIINTLKELFKSKDEEKLKRLLEALNIVSESNAKYFIEDFERLFLLLLEISIDTNFDDKIPQLAIEIAITIIENESSLLGESPANLLVPLLKAVMSIMRNLPFELEADWVKPQALFFFEEDENCISFGQKSIDRLFDCAGSEGLEFTWIESPLMEYLSNETDWRYKHAGLLVASNIGPLVDDPSKLSGLVLIMISHMKHPHPRIRFAAAHCIGQLADDLNTEFPNMYSDKIIPGLLDALNDTIPRVQRHACSALCNVIEKMDENTINQYINTLMIKLEDTIKKAEPMVQEYVISAIAAISEAAPEKFAVDYYNQTMMFLLRVLKECKEMKYKKLRGHTIECITVMGRAVGKEKFVVYAKDVIEVLYQIQESELDSQDPQKCFLLSSWQRLCLMLKEELVPYVELLVPSLLKLAASVPGIAISTMEERTVDLEEAIEELNSTTLPSPEEKRKMIYLTTTDIEEKEAAINMLGTLAEELGGYLDKYVERLSEIVLNVLRYSRITSLRGAAAMSLKGLIKAIKQPKTMNFPPDYLSTVTKAFLETLIKATQEEYTSGSLFIIVEAMKDVIDTAGKCLDTACIMKMFEVGTKILKDSENSCQNNTRKQISFDFEIEMPMDDKKENDLQLEVVQMIGILFKTHPDESLGLVQPLYSDFLTIAFKEGSTEHEKQLGLFLVVDMIEHFGYSRIPVLYPQFVDLVLNYSQSDTPEIKQVCLYGIGAIAITANTFYPTVAVKCYDTLRQTIDTPQISGGNEWKWRSIRDNAISSLGKTIKYQGAVFSELGEMLQYWLEHMPLRTDLEEGAIQNEFLADLVINKTAFLHNKDNLEKVIDIFIDGINLNTFPKAVCLKASKALKVIVTTPEFKERVGVYEKKMEEEGRGKLENYLKA